MISLKKGDSGYVLGYGHGIGSFVVSYVASVTGWDTGKTRINHHGIVFYCYDYATRSNNKLVNHGDMVIPSVFDTVDYGTTDTTNRYKLDIPDGFSIDNSYTVTDKIRFYMPGIYAFISDDVINVYVIESITCKGLLGEAKLGEWVDYTSDNRVLKGITFITADSSPNLWGFGRWITSTYLNDFEIVDVQYADYETKYINRVGESDSALFSITSVEKTPWAHDSEYRPLFSAYVLSGIVYYPESWIRIISVPEISYIRRVGGSQLFCYLEDGTVIPFQRTRKNFYGYGETQLNGLDYGSYMLVSIDGGEQVKMDYWQKRNIYVPAGGD